MHANHRHPKATSRPPFSVVVRILQFAESILLAWTDEDRAIDPQAAQLGAPLEAGEELYPELQDSYTQ